MYSKSNCFLNRHILFGYMNRDTICGYSEGLFFSPHHYPLVMPIQKVLVFFIMASTYNFYSRHPLFLFSVPPFSLLGTPFFSSRYPFFLFSVPPFSLLGTPFFSSRYPFFLFSVPPFSLLGTPFFSSRYPLFLFSVPLFSLLAGVV